MEKYIHNYDELTRAQMQMVGLDPDIPLFSYDESGIIEVYTNPYDYWIHIHINKNCIKINNYSLYVTSITIPSLGDRSSHYRFTLICSDINIKDAEYEVNWDEFDN